LFIFSNISANYTGNDILFPVVPSWVHQFCKPSEAVYKIERKKRPEGGAKGILFFSASRPSFLTPKRGCSSSVRAGGS
jgi:hypothetical protein